MASQTVLIPMEFPDPEPLPSTFIDAFTSCKVILLGLYELPADIEPDERHRREVKAYNTLYSTAASFVRHGDTADVELVMGQDLEDAPTTIAEERDVDAFLVPNPITTLGHVLIAICDEKFAEPVGEFMSTLHQDILLHTTLLYVAETEDEVDEGEALLKEVEQKVIAAGYPRTRIDTEVRVGKEPSFPISQAAANNDLVIMGETQSSAYNRIFGKVYESVAENTEIPIAVIRE